MAKTVVLDMDEVMQMFSTMADLDTSLIIGDNPLLAYIINKAKSVKQYQDETGDKFVEIYVIGE